MALSDENDKLIQKWACLQKSFISYVPAQVGHHYKSRRHLLLRWDTDNIIPLTNEEHRLVHDGKLKIYLKSSLEDKLTLLANSDFKQYLFTNNLTEKEFEEQKNRELKEKINGIINQRKSF